MSVWKMKNGRWTAKFWYQNKPYQKKGFMNRSTAQKWEVETREVLQKQGEWIHLISFQELATKYLEDCQVRFQLNTWRAKANYYRHFQSFLESDTPIDHIKKLSILDYLNVIVKSKGNKTANRHLKDLKALFNWGMRNDLIYKNPLRGIEPFSEDEFKKYVPPVEDINKVMLIANQEDMDLLICLYHTGGRIGEILRLSWDDINFEQRWIKLWTRKRKRGGLESGKLAMTNKLHDVLRTRWSGRNKASSYVFCNDNGKPFRYDQKKNLMRILCKRAGVKTFGFHAIRHHVASILMDSGKATLGQIQQFLRHKRKTTTENYLHDIGNDLIAVAEILNENDGNKKNKIVTAAVTG